MYKIIDKKKLANNIYLMKIEAPIISEKAQPGQFIILRIDEKGERFPLTLADWNNQEGTISVIFLEVGVSTKKLAALEVQDKISDILGPLGNPTDIRNYGLVCIVGGGVGIAPIYPIAKALKKAGNKLILIIGAKTSKQLILEDEIRKYSDEMYISTDDGSKGQKGFVSDVLRHLIEEGYSFNLVYAIGPSVMMRAVAKVTKPYKIKTIVSLNSIMIDGMGMCGGCRVTIGDKAKFACVDGPEFNAHKVDFEELIKKQQMFVSEEKNAEEQWKKGCTCNEHP